MQTSKYLYLHIKILYGENTVRKFVDGMTQQKLKTRKLFYYS